MWSGPLACRLVMSRGIGGQVRGTFLSSWSKVCGLGRCVSGHSGMGVLV